MTLDLVVASRSNLALLAGAILFDTCFGEPPAVLHPVVWMGGVTRLAVRRLARGAPLGQLVAGVALAVAVPCLFAGGSAALLRLSSRWPGTAVAVLRFAAAVWLLKSAIALRALGQAARGVAQPLARGDLVAARRGLASLCSRDAAQLDERALVAGAVESLAENASDSVIAPLFYFVLFGLPGVIFYRAVNTLDAMVGYHGRYEWFGKASARLDDLLNLAPARITAVLLLLAGGVLGHDARSGWRILRRDGARTESPNAGWPMAAMAGLLGVALEKPGHYRLGDDHEPSRTETIAAAWRIVSVTCAIAVALAALVLALRAIRAG